LRWPWQQEVRTVPETEVAADLLQALINPGLLTKGQAISIPTVLSCVNFVADIVSMMPIKLYKDTGEQAIEVKEDLRVKLLNDDPGDTLDSVQFWRAIIRDYYLGKGGYVYINREFNTIKSLHYVKEENVSINKNTDPIFKKYQILVNGINYWPYEFIKILRNTQDGAQGKSVIEESPLILSVVYNALIFEDTLVRKGGNKKGFLKSERRLTEAAIETLKQAWRNLYSNNSDNVVVLNEGLEFQEASNTSVEMQLNENKSTNSAEICKVFNIAEMSLIENALNRELLLEDEKGSYYFAFDTKEMLKGDIKERFEAYRTAIDANFMGVDEVRYLEDLPSLGIDWIKLGLDSVLYDVKNKTIYTPNTNQTSKINDMKGGEENQS